MQLEISQERVIDAYNNAPKPVRDAFNSSATTEAVRAIQTEYRLHIDTAGDLRKQVGYMLLGLISPTEFFGQLVLNGIDQNDARTVLDALNKRIFIPLQEKMRGSEGEEERDTSYITYGELEGDEEDESIPDTLPTPDISYQSAAFAPRSAPDLGMAAPQITAVPQPAPAVSQPVQQPQPLPQNLMESQPAQLAAPAVAPAPVVQPLMRTMNHDIEVLQHPSQATPAMTFQTSSIPQSSAWTVSAASAPAVAPPTPVIPPEIHAAVARMAPIDAAPVPQTLPGSLPPTRPPAPPVRSEPLVQKHTGDPYREPLD